MAAAQACGGDAVGWSLALVAWEWQALLDMRSGSKKKEKACLKQRQKGKKKPH